MRNVQALETTEAEELDRSKFENWKLIQGAVSNRSEAKGGLQLVEVPSRSLFLRKSEFPASKVTADICWTVNESTCIGQSATGLVDLLRKHPTSSESDGTSTEGSISVEGRGSHLGRTQRFDRFPGGPVLNEH